MGDGRLREVVAHGGSTVVTCTVGSLGNALATCPLAFARMKIRKKNACFPG